MEFPVSMGASIVANEEFWRQPIQSNGAEDLARSQGSFTQTEPFLKWEKSDPGPNLEAIPNLIEAKSLDGG